MARRHPSRARRLGLVGALFACAAAVLAVTSVVGPANAGTQTFGAVADAYVSAAHPTSNFGTETRLKVDAFPVVVHAYLLFNVQIPNDTVARATLRLYTRSSSNVGIEIRGVSSSSWSETAITFANAPPPSATVTRTSGSFSSGEWLSLDVTPLVTQNGAVSLALTTTSSSGPISVASREDDASSDPELVVETATSPVAPTNIENPTISGIAQEGQTLTATSGTWTGTEPITYAYQWQRCDSAGSACVNITGATSQTYTLASSDVGGTIRVRVTATNSAGSSTASSSATSVVAAAPPPTVDPVIAGAGDIAASSGNHTATADVLSAIDPTAVFTLGDNVYPDGTLAEFQSYYDPSWGRLKTRTNPAPGNHDYHTSGAGGYFSYFGSRAPAAYYAWSIGAWRFYSLNSEIANDANSAQIAWLKEDLAANPKACVGAYWHKPLFSSGMHGNSTSQRPFWDALYAANADLILVGHDHDYERFAPQTPSGQLDTVRGIREFVVGTGGKTLRAFATIQPNSEVRETSIWGVLKLTLHDNSYDWKFEPIAGQTFAESGSQTCH